MRESNDRKAPSGFGAAGQLRALTTDAIGLLDGHAAVANELDALEFARNSIGASDPHLRRIGGTVAFNHLARVSPLLDDDRLGRWRSALDLHLPPIARSIEETLTEQQVLHGGTLDRLSQRLSELAIEGLVDPSAPDVWADCESLSRVARPRTDLVAVHKSEPAIHFIQPLAVRGADTAIRALRSRVEQGCGRPTPCGTSARPAISPRSTRR